MCIRDSALDAATVGTPTPDNRYVGWPYTKHEVAVMDVDMSAALLVATGEKADALGISEDRRLYLTGWAYAAVSYTHLGCGVGFAGRR